MHVKEKIKFPDLLGKWPFPRTCTPTQTSRRSPLNGFKAFPTQEEMNAFKCCNFGMFYISIRVAAMNNLS